MIPLVEPYAIELVAGVAFDLRLAEQSHSVFADSVSNQVQGFQALQLWAFGVDANALVGDSAVAQVEFLQAFRNFCFTRLPPVTRGTGVNSKPGF